VTVTAGGAGGAGTTTTGGGTGTLIFIPTPTSGPAKRGSAVSVEIPIAKAINFLAFIFLVFIPWLKELESYRGKNGAFWALFGEKQPKIAPPTHLMQNGFAFSKEFRNLRKQISELKQLFLKPL
jgi:hypothetical protein